MSPAWNSWELNRVHIVNNTGVWAHAFTKSPNRKWHKRLGIPSPNSCCFRLFPTKCPILTKSRTWNYSSLMRTLTVHEVDGIYWTRLTHIVWTIYAPCAAWWILLYQNPSWACACERQHYFMRLCLISSITVSRYIAVEYNTTLNSIRKE